MKKFAKILVFVVALALALSVIGVSAFAVDDTSDGITLYLKPNSNWNEASARFAVYTWDGGEQWFDMSSVGDGYYVATVPAGTVNIIFCRMNPSTSENNWNNKWNQTGDLQVQTDGTNCCAINDGQWDCGSNVTWSTFTCAHSNVAGSEVVVKAPTCTETGLTQYTCSKCGVHTEVTPATGHSYGTDGFCSCGASVTLTVAGDLTDFFGTSWDPANTANALTYDEASELWTITYVNDTASTVWPNFKVCLDYGWNKCWGAAAAGIPDSDNAWVDTVKTISEQSSSASCAELHR